MPSIHQDNWTDAAPASVKKEEHATMNLKKQLHRLTCNSRPSVNALHDPSSRLLRASSFSIWIAASSIFSPSEERGMGFSTSLASAALRQPGGARQTAQAGTLSSSSHVGVEP